MRDPQVSEVIYYVEILEVDLISGAGWIVCAITLAFLALKHRPSFADSTSTYVKSSWVCLALCEINAMLFSAFTSGDSEPQLFSPSIISAPLIE